MLKHGKVFLPNFMHSLVMSIRSNRKISNRMTFNGKEVITWSVNDYLGLSNHPEVRKVDSEAAKNYGSAYPMGARMMSGHTDMHENLENDLAKFVSKESAYVLNFGYQGILSIVDTLVNKNDVIVYDIDSHACIVDGVRLHVGKRFTFQHNDIESLEKNSAANIISIIAVENFLNPFQQMF